MCTGPPATNAPGSKVRVDLQSDKEPAAVTFHPKTLHLHILQDGPNILLDNSRFSDHQRNYNVLIDQSNSVNLVRKTGPDLPATLYLVFDVNFDEATHGVYLQEHLKTVHMSGSQASQIIGLIKRHWRVFDPGGMCYSVIG